MLRLKAGGTTRSRPQARRAKRPARGASKGSAPAANSFRPTGSPANQLAQFFRRNGYLRRQDKSRLKKEGYLGYKKGEELRFSANSKAELILIRRLLQRLGFKPSRPFLKDNQFRQPIYSRSEIKRLLGLMRIRV